MNMDLSIVPAYFLDLLIGDPRGYPHPVRIIGWAVQRLESLYRKRFSNQIIAGAALTVIIVGGTYFLAWAIIKVLTMINPLAGTIGSILLIYTTISIRDLYNESKPILDQLQQGNIPYARKSLAMIVGRDTQNLDNSGIVKATVETISESTVDGIISPLFYAFIGGAPLALAFKAINTLDSMIGHNDENYRLFGKFSARLDDAANFIPARLGGIIIILASLICRLDAKNSTRIVLRDGQKHLSPNSGIPEAAFAGALGIQLGGASFYDGELLSKPHIGDSTREPDSGDIINSHRIMFAASSIALVVFIITAKLLGH